MPIKHPGGALWICREIFRRPILIQVGSARVPQRCVLRRGDSWPCQAEENAARLECVQELMDEVRFTRYSAR